MSRSKQPESDKPPGAGADSNPSFGSRPLARLADLASKLPSLPKTDLPAAPAPKDQGSFAKALSGRIVIQRDARGRGGKTVTIARGVVGSEALLEKLARELRHELGAGVRVEDGALFVQGAQSERLAVCLARRGAARVVLGN
ncbi:MAG TPA: translation initiation factor [Planctomycetota bacterium]|nr:translation initiation factor [Planctomycetota bacterium]